MTDGSVDDPLAPSDGLPVPLDAQRARRFLRELRDRPFIAIVADVDGAKVRIYSKGIDADEVLRTMHAVMDVLDDNEETSA